MPMEIAISLCMQRSVVLVCNMYSASSMINHGLIYIVSLGRVMHQECIK